VIAPATASGRKPIALARYETSWLEPFEQAIAPSLVPGVRVLDLGSGRNPFLEPETRPIDAHYAGFDLSNEELMAAGPTAYDELIVGDILREQPRLRGQFDLVISWQVLEHVRDLDLAVENVRRYLRDGGLFTAMLSGSFAVYALANRLLPNGMARAVVTRTMHRTPERTPVFPARYHRCYASALRRVFAGWSQIHVQPFYRAGGYFDFSRPLQRMYLSYENFVYRRRIENLASHYLVVAVR
jgi:SAM-dependent methyltransferase